MDADTPVDPEQLEVGRRRYQEALDAGVGEGAALIFADNHVDIGLLRRLVRDGCPPPLIGRLII